MVSLLNSVIVPAACNLTQVILDSTGLDSILLACQIAKGVIVFTLSDMRHNCTSNAAHVSTVVAFVNT